MTSLVRAIGRWTLVALLVNSIVGSAIFGLPSVIAGMLGRASPLAYLLGALLMGVIVACFAEVASQFQETGGPYLYAREAFGAFAGIQIGWLSWMMRLTATAGGTNLFVTYLGELWPPATNPLPRAVILTAVISLLSLVNYRGVIGGARMSNIFTVAKMSLLFAFVGGGLVYLVLHPEVTRAVSQAQVMVHPIAKDWFRATILLVFAYGGFESGLVPMAEAKNPRRDAPFALGTALLTVTVLYALLQVVVIHILPDPAATDRPVAAAAGAFLGPFGAKLIALIALFSLYGYLSAMTLNTPRLTYALAERRDFPAWFAAIHPRFHTPHVSILLYAVLLWVLALAGSFRWNIALSAVARLFGYALVCASLLVFRRRHPDAQAFRLPGGVVFSIVGVLASAFLLTQMSRSELYVMLLTMLLALLTWLWARRSAT